MKISVKSERGVCGKSSSIQVFYNRSGTEKYARARHYLGIVNGKPQFEYHQQSLQYITGKLGETTTGITETGHIGQSTIVDLNKAELSSKSKKEAGPVGFEPTTFSLEG
jgi:hypothetical protein